MIKATTAAHLKDSFQRLPAHCVDSAAASEERRYISLDVAEVLPTIMDADGPNRESFLSRLGSVVRRAGAVAGLNHRKVVVLGEMVAVLCAEGKLKAAIEVEQLWNELARTNDFHLCCAYPMTEDLKGSPYATICAEHSAVLPATESNYRIVLSVRGQPCLAPFCFRHYRLQPEANIRLPYPPRSLCQS